ncbi:MAG TPA: AraC family transcriptional regulator [Cyclobacteriaceae bacterium]
MYTVEQRMINEVILPKALLSDKESESPISIYKHTSHQNSLRNKILLQQNLISLVINGQKIIYYGGKVIEINNDQFIILSAGNCLMTEKISNTKEYGSIILLFDNDTWINFFVKYAALIAKKKWKGGIMDEPFLILDKDPFINNFISNLDFLLQHNIPCSPDMKQLKFEEIMLYLLEKYPKVILSFEPSRQIKHSDYEIKRTVELNITNNLTLEELAFLCNTSSSTFKRRFVKLYNAQPNQYFLHRRMELAATLLIQHRKNPSEIFYEVGYKNLSSFSQSFKLVYGVSPKQYQQRHLIVYQ